jgi:hypothetical protein
MFILIVVSLKMCLIRFQICSISHLKKTLFFVPKVPLSSLSMKLILFYTSTAVFDGCTVRALSQA